MDDMHDWPGRAHVETLRIWPALEQTVRRIAAQAEVFSGALLVGSLSRGEGDAISDADIVAVTRVGMWDDAWDSRQVLSAGALVTFDRFGDRPRVAGHNWLTPALTKVECLVAEPGDGGMRLYGNAVVILGEPDLRDSFERRPALTRQEVDAYAAEIREQNALPSIERAYGDLIVELRREVRGVA